MLPRIPLTLLLVLTVGTSAAPGQQSTETGTTDEIIERLSSEPEPSVEDFGSPVFPDESALFGDAVQGGQTFLRAAGSNFHPRDSSTTFSYSGGGCMQRNSNAGDSWFTYDVQIPDGSEIDFLRVYFYDNDATFDVNSELWAFDGAGGTTLIAEADSTGTPGFSSAGSNFFSHFVDNINESLVVVVSIEGGVGSSLRLCGVRLRYQGPGVFADGFETGDTSAWSNAVPIVPVPPEPTNPA